MLSNEQEQFYRALDGLFSIHDKEPKPLVFEIWWDVLKEFSLDDVLKAMSKHARTSVYMPKPAEICSLLNGSITASEAWAHMPKNDNEGIYTNQRMLYAYGMAEEAIHNGDMIAARKDFQVAYDSDTAHEKSEVFFYSEGEGVPYEEKDARKESDFKQLESAGWVKGKELLYLAPPALKPAIEKKLIDSGVLALEDQS